MSDISIKKQTWELPGGLFIWLISVHETLLFFISLAIFKYQKSTDAVLFSQESSFMNLSQGAFYTVLLIGSGWAIAEAQSKYTISRRGTGRAAKNYHLLGLVLGIAFLSLKIFDFTDKIKINKKFGDNAFWTFYWFLNSFHFFHVLVGVIFLIFLFFKLRKKPENKDIELFNSVAIFWHACDIIWILLFTSLYIGN
ncbi:MAG: cytochrome c oxidase subunit 3 [Pseudobdellovibrio sp.]